MRKPCGLPVSDTQSRSRERTVAHFHLGPSQAHVRWDHSIPPVLRIRPGDVVTFDLPDSSGGHISESARAADLAGGGDPNPLVGPVYLEGAEIGDALEVAVGRIHPR